MLNKRKSLLLYPPKGRARTREPIADLGTFELFYHPENRKLKKLHLIQGQPGNGRLLYNNQL